LEIKIFKFNIFYKIALSILYFISLISLSYFYYESNTKLRINFLKEKLILSTEALFYFIDPINIEDLKIIKESENKIKNTTIKKLTNNLRLDSLFIIEEVNGNYYQLYGNLKSKLIYKPNQLPFLELPNPLLNGLKKLNDNENSSFINYNDEFGEYTSYINFKFINNRKFYFGSKLTNEKIYSLSSSYINKTFFLLLIGIILYSLFYYELSQFKYYKLPSRYNLIIPIIILALFSIFSFTYYIVSFYSNLKKIEMNIYKKDHYNSFSYSIHSIFPPNYYERVFFKDNINPSEIENFNNKINEYLSKFQIHYFKIYIEFNNSYFEIFSLKDSLKSKSEIINFPLIDIDNKYINYLNKFEYFEDEQHIYLPIKYYKGINIYFSFNQLNSFNEGDLYNYLFKIITLFFIISLHLLILINLFKFLFNDNSKLKFISIKFKFIFYIGITSISGFVGISYIFNNYSEELLKTKTIETCQNLAYNIANIAKEDLIIGNTFEATKSSIDDNFQIGMIGLRDIYIMDVFGKYVVNYSDEKTDELANYIDISIIKSIDNIELKESIDERGLFNVLKIYFPIFTIHDGIKIKIGAAIFEYNRDLLYQPIYKAQNTMNYIGIILLLIILSITLFIAIKTTDPITKLTQGVQIISGGNLDYTISINARDEIGLLSDKFNEMTSKIKDYTHNLESMVEQRTREVVQSQETLQKVLSDTPLILFLIDEDGNIIFAQGKGLTNFGLSGDQVKGIPLNDLFSETPQLYFSLQEAKNGNDIKIEIIIENIFFEIQFSVLRDSNKEFIGVIVLFIDITDRKKAEDAIKKAMVEVQTEKKKSDQLLLNILPIKIADELKEKGEVKPVSLRSVSILFTDFKGFTKIASKLSPEELVNELNGIFTQFDQICERRNIEKLKTIGDAFMCAGGLPVINNTHPIDICLTALEMQLFMRMTGEIIRNISGKEFWDMRVGIHTGSVVSGVIGKSKFAYDIWGDSVNIASRMESNCEVSKINISVDTYRFIKEFFECEHRGEIEVKNRGLIDMYFLHKLKPKYSADNNGMTPNDLFQSVYNDIENGKIKI
jgi:PAS domain S-box-containing protein